MLTSWQETAKGRALHIEVADRHISFYPFEMEKPEYAAATGAISLWEGIAGTLPHGIIARWRWRRGLRKLQRDIAKEVRIATTE